MSPSWRTQATRGWAYLREAVNERLLERGGWLAGGAGIQAVLAFAANLALVRLLRPEDFGRFAIIQANVGLANTFLNLKLDDLVLRDTDDRLTEERLGKLTASLIFQTTGLALLGSAVLAFLNLLSAGAWFVLAGAIATNWLGFVTRLYERNFEYRNLSIIETSSHAGGHSVAVAGALVGIGPIVLYLRQPLQAAGRFLGLASVDGLRRLPVQWLSIKEWKALLAEVRGLWADGLLAQSFDRLTILSVGGLAGEATTGFFFQARRLAITPHQLVGPVSLRMGFNYFSHKISPEHRRPTLLVAAVVLGVGLSVIAVAAGWLADPVIPWLFGEDWARVVPLFRLMLGLVVAMSVFTLIQAYHMAAEQMASFLWIGRGTQYAMIGLAMAGAFWIFPDKAAEILGVGLSASFVVPVVVLVILLALHPRSA